MASTVSKSEREFIEGGVQCNVRADGRSRLDFRPFSILTGVATQTNGSARIKLAGTDVLVGVKAEIGEPDAQSPDCGRLQVQVDCLPSASLAFEGRGAEDLNAELERIVGRVLHSSSTALDFRSLSIVPGRQCWVLYVDALVFESDGNLIDAVCIGSKAALYDTRIPKITVVASDESGEPEIEISDDIAESVRLAVDSLPLCVTLARVGPRFIADPSREEEACSSVKVSIAINKKGDVCSIQKGGSAGLDPSALGELLSVSKRIGQRLNQRLDEMLRLSELDQIDQARTVGKAAQRDGIGASFGLLASA